MKLEEKLKIQKNFSYLVQELLTDDIVDDLYSNYTINHDDLQRINAEKTDGDKVKCLINILYSKENAFQPFLTEVGRHRPDIKEKLQNTEIEGELRAEKERRIEFLNHVIQERYCLRDGKSIAESNILKEIAMEYWRSGKGNLPEDTERDLIECMITLFPTASRRETKQKENAWIYCNIDRKELESSDELAEKSETATETGIREKVEVATKEETVSLISILPANIGTALQPFFLKENIDVANLKIFKKQAISGKIFAKFTLDDIKEICPDMPYGHKKTVLEIRDEILSKEKAEGPCLQILDNRCPKADNHYSSDVETDNPWQRLRELDMLAQQDKKYVRNALVRSINLYKHNLIEPIHSFIDAGDTSEGSLLNCIKESFSMFIAACLTDRTNGIIHFGIREETDEYGEKRGRIIGFEASPSVITEMIYETIKNSFFDDQLPIILQCVRPPQFIKLTDISNSEQLYVVEIDVLPSFELTKYRTFYLRDANLMPRTQSSQQVLSVYNFEEARPTRLNEAQLIYYNDTKAEICDNREKMEKSQSPFQRRENLSQQFLDLYSAGNRTKLRKEIYPVLILSPLDSVTPQKMPMSENFEFLVDVDPVVIFDFQPTGSRGLLDVVDSFQNHTVKPYIIEDFDRKNEDNIIQEVENNRQTLPGWVFCNGYAPLEMKPLNKLDWKTKRSESFKEAVRIYQDCIPNGRAFVIFAIFSKTYDIMLEIVEEVILKFQKQWIVLAEEADLLDKWKSELLRRSSVDEQTLRQRCIAGISWAELTCIVKEVKDIQRNSECQLPTSTGSFCCLKDKTRSELCDIDILSRNECEESELIKDREQLETQKRKSEEEFYRGARVSWWNMYFHKDQILKRSHHHDIYGKMQDLLKGWGSEDDSKVVVFNLYHQPGCGGTTTAMHILWSLRKIYRCCIVRKITDDTHKQIDMLRVYEDKNPMPPVVLIDNEDEIKITNLRLKLESIARLASRKSESKLQVYCLLFVCVRRVHLPDFVDKQSVVLFQRLDIKEIEWFRDKQDMLMQKHTENPSIGADPKTLIAFNLLKENFDEDYIERNADLYVDGVKDEKERKLLLYLSLINTFDIEFQSIPKSSFDDVMSKNSKERKVMRYTMRRRQNYDTDLWETQLSTSLDDLLNRNIEVNAWSQGIKIVSKVFARALLLNMLKKEGIQLYEAMCTFLKSTVLKGKGFSITVLKRIVQDLLKKREVLENGKKEMFSPLVSYILKIEGGDRAAEVLECGFERTNDAMVAQQTARLYISLKNWEKAEEFAQKAVTEKGENSYLWDTYGQIYFKRLADVYETCLQDESLLTQKEIQDVVDIAFKGISHFEKEQLLSEREQSTTDNDAGYFGELKTIVLVLDLFTQWNKDRGQLHRFFVFDAIPSEYKAFQEKHVHFLKGLHNRSEKALRKLEDKYSQLKNAYRGPSNFNSALEVEKLRENLDTYFGEASVEIPKNLSSKDSASFCRRRINRIGGRSLVSILRLRNEKQSDGIFEEIYQKSKFILESGFASLHDYLTLLGVSLVRSIDSEDKVDFESMLKWSSRAYKMATDLSKNDHPNLEAYMYFVILHWPTEHRQKYERHLCPPEEIAEAIQSWKKAFRKKYPRQDDTNIYRKKETTYFFLGSGGKDIIYYEELGDNSRYQDGDVFRTESVMTKLQRLKGVLLRTWEIKYQITSVQGNTSSINITNSFPTSTLLCNRTVYFYVGFSWNGPKAFYITKEEYPEVSTSTELSDEQSSRHTQPKRSRNEYEMYENVSTHSKLSKALKEIDRQLHNLNKSKRPKENFKEEETKLKEEKALKERRQKLIETRLDYLQMRTPE